MIRAAVGFEADGVNLVGAALTVVEGGLFGFVSSLFGWKWLSWMGCLDEVDGWWLQGENAKQPADLSEEIRRAVWRPVMEGEPCEVAYLGLNGADGIGQRRVIAQGFELLPGMNDQRSGGTQERTDFTQGEPGGGQTASPQGFSKYSVFLGRGFHRSDERIFG